MASETALQRPVEHQLVAVVTGGARGIPMKRVGSTTEIFRTAAFLLSDNAGYITGQNIHVDDGLTHHV